MNATMQVNRMCSSLTDQVRSIAVVTTAVARGDLTQKIEISVEGEMSTLKGAFPSPPFFFPSLLPLPPALLCRRASLLLFEVLFGETRLIWLCGYRHRELNGGPVVRLRVGGDEGRVGGRDAGYLGRTGARGGCTGYLG